RAGAGQLGRLQLTPPAGRVAAEARGGGEEHRAAARAAGAEQVRLVAGGEPPLDGRPRAGGHGPSRGHLTIRPESLARPTRRHRIVERFLADILGYAWNEADKFAIGFEHELPDEVLERLFVALHRPATCPHGFPIPQIDDDELPATPDLYALEPGEVAEVALS